MPKRLGIKKVLEFLNQQADPNGTGWGFDNILDEVEEGKLNIYVRSAVWKYKSINSKYKKYKDQIEIFLNNQNITGELNNFQLEIEQLALIRKNRNQPTFRLLAPCFKLKNSFIEKINNNEKAKLLMMELECSIQEKILDHLMVLSCNLRNQLVDNQTYKKHGQYELLTKKKIEIINTLVRQGKDKKVNGFGMYELIHFLPLPPENNIRIGTTVGLYPKPNPISEPVNFKDVYFLEEDILNFKNKKTASKTKNSKDKTFEDEEIKDIKRFLADLGKYKNPSYDKLNLDCAVVDIYNAMKTNPARYPNIFSLTKSVFSRRWKKSTSQLSGWYGFKKGARSNPRFFLRISQN